MQNNKARKVKIISMGDPEVGKSCIIKRYCEKRFVSKYASTIGIDYGVAKITLKDEEVRANIFDFSGNPIYYEVRNEFYKDTQGVLLVYDTSSAESFNSLGKWISEMHRHIKYEDEINKIVVVVCGNKADKKRQVEESRARYWAMGNNYRYFECSAKTGEGIIEIFDTLLDEIYYVCKNGHQAVSNENRRDSIEAIKAINRLTNGKTDFERLGIKHDTTAEEINKVYKKLAFLLHPDKCCLPGTEGAFKILSSARISLLRRI